MASGDNYIIGPEDISYSRLRELLLGIGQPSEIVDLSGDTLVIQLPGNCSWFIRIREDNSIVFTGIGYFLPRYGEKERWRLINGANIEARLSRFSFLGERALEVSYILVCSSGLPTGLFLDSWLALKKEQDIFGSWLREITPAERASLRLNPGGSNFLAVGSTIQRRQQPMDGRKDFMLGCLFGGAIGEALGTPAASMNYGAMQTRFGSGGISRFEEAFGGVGKIGWGTQMSLFTLEAVLRGRMRAYDCGSVNTDDMFFHAYLRWARTQGISIKDYKQSVSEEFPGWLVFCKEMYDKRNPDSDCLQALADANRQGSVQWRVNSSKGCGGVIRAAPAGFFDTHPAPFEQGCRLAAVTNGHPTGYLAGGFLAELVSRLRKGVVLADAVDSALERLKLARDGGEIVARVEKALTAARHDSDPHCALEALGDGRSAESVLAIALYCAGRTSDFHDGVLMAVNHSGDSGNTGAVAGNILGAMYGYGSLPEPWREQVELREILLEMVDDALDIFDRNPGLDRFWKRYPPH